MGIHFFRSEIEDSKWFPKHEYPFASNYIELGAGRMHYVDEGQGEVLVFVHGTPSWSFEFREEIRELRTSFRCIALDHLGFGLSERPDHWDYSVESHQKNFEEFVAKLGLNRFSLIVHDFGGPIALPFAMNNPDQIKSLVILNSWFWAMETVEPKFLKDKKWINTALMKFLYLRMNFSAQTMVKMAWGKHRPLDHKTHDHYRKLFSSADSRKSTWALAQAMADTQNNFSNYEQRISFLKSIPSLLIWGAQDRFITLAHLKKWRSLLPTSDEYILSDVGHFPMDEAPELVTPKMREFLSGK